MERRPALPAESGPGWVLRCVHPMLPDLKADYPLPRNDQTRARGLRLFERFLEQKRAAG